MDWFSGVTTPGKSGKGLFSLFLYTDSGILFRKKHHQYVHYEGIRKTTLSVTAIPCITLFTPVLTPPSRQVRVGGGCNSSTNLRFIGRMRISPRPFLNLAINHDARIKLHYLKYVYKGQCASSSASAAAQSRLLVWSLPPCWCWCWCWNSFIGVNVLL